MEEKKSIKVSLGTVVCLFIIMLLIMGLVGMYLYYNKNNSNIIVGKESEVKINEIGEKEVYKTSDFESIYKSLVDSEYSNLKSFITSDNKIKEIRVSGITIYTEDYLNATGIKLTENISENDVIGSCVFTVEFENVEGLALAGSKGNIHAVVGNCLTDQKDFVFNKDTNKIELCTSVYQSENQDKKEDIKTIHTSDLTTLNYYINDETANIFYAYIEDGYLYYFNENADVNKISEGTFQFMSGIIKYPGDKRVKKYEGLNNIKKMTTYNIGTGINPVVFLITETGEVYSMNIYSNFSSSNGVNIETYEGLKDYKIEDILSHDGEMYSVFEVLLKDGSTETVTVN